MSARRVSMVRSTSSLPLEGLFAACAVLLAAHSARAQSFGCEVAKLFASDADPGDLLGGAISLSGDTLLVGAIGVDGVESNIGGAYVYVKTPEGWVEHQTLVPPDGAANDAFGGTVAIDGDTIVIGASSHDGGLPNSGAAYVYTRSEGVWTFSQKLKAFDAVIQDNFGTAVAIDGDTIAVGAKRDDAPLNSSGSVYVFTRSAGVWALQQKIVAVPVIADADFGQSVALSGDTLLVGANAENSGAGNGAGSASVFVRTGSVWSFQAKFLPPDPVAFGWFGYSVALDGDLAVVGAPGIEGSPPGPSIAYAYRRTGTAWSLEHKLIPSDTSASGLGGFSVAVQGERAAVSTPAGNNGNAVFVFGKSNGTWTQQQKISPALPPANFDQFGRSVAWSGELIAVGARGDDERLIDTGAAYLFNMSTDDCNGNEIADLCDIESGASLDSNSDGIPDECQPCAMDVDQNGAVDGGDIAWVLGFWGLSWGADLDGSGTVDGADLAMVLGAWGSCP